ncbi:MAG: putative oxidoreductase, partial [Candidatus Doudnabacteria bacterium Gr01-1014_77]
GDILTDENTIKEFSRDASIFEIKPEVVIAPADVSDIQKIVNFVSETKDTDPGVSITARAAGSCMSGGALNTSIILDFKKHLNKLIEIGSDYAVVEPGMFYRDFEKQTLEHNLLLPPFPASREICAIGGMLGNNAAGEKTLTHGKIEDYVLELNVILADGNEYVFKALNEEELKQKLSLQNFEGDVYRKTHQLIQANQALIDSAKPNVSKNSAGYYLWNIYDKEKKIFDLTKLFVGSQGTLGIITKAKLKLVPPEQNSTMVVVFLKNLDGLVTIVQKILALKPETFESYDDYTLKLAIRFLPDLIKILKPKNMLKMGWQFLPEFWMTLTGGFPKLVLLAEFTGKTHEESYLKAQNAFNQVKAMGVKTHLIKDEQEANKYWVIRRESFALLRKHVKNKHTAPFIDDIIVRPEFLPEFLPKLNKLIQKYKLTYTIAGHVGNGNFHIIPLMDFKDPNTARIIPKLSDEVYNLVLAYHGSITAEHNDGLIRSPYLKQMYGEKVFKLFEETKKIFDPKNIFNPGKKVGSSLEYAMQQIIRE